MLDMFGNFRNGVEIVEIEARIPVSLTEEFKFWRGGFAGLSFAANESPGRTALFGVGKGACAKVRNERQLSP
jgi:hypothetical protein